MLKHLKCRPRLKYEAVLGVVILWSVLVVYMLIVNATMSAAAAQKVHLHGDRQHRGTKARQPVQLVVQATVVLETDVQLQKQSPDTVQVVIASDSNSLGGLIATVNSVNSNTKARVHFYIVTTRDEATHLKTWIIATRLHKLHYTLKEARAADIRKVKMEFAQIFPEIEGKIIFLDCDVIVQGDVVELFAEPNISPGDFGSFTTDCSKDPDSGITFFYSSYVNIYHSKYFKFQPDPKKCPINTGLFVANATTWREKKVTDKMQYWLDAHKKEPITAPLGGSDDVRAALMIETYNQTSEIDPGWHVHRLGSSSGRYSKQLVESAQALHWSGGWKPWRHRSAHVELWDRYFIPDPTGQMRPERPSKRRGFNKQNENSRGF